MFFVGVFRGDVVVVDLYVYGLLFFVVVFWGVVLCCFVFVVLFCCFVCVCFCCFDCLFFFWVFFVVVYFLFLFVIFWGRGFGLFLYVWNNCTINATCYNWTIKTITNKPDSQQAVPQTRTYNYFVAFSHMVCIHPISNIIRLLACQSYLV